MKYSKKDKIKKNRTWQNGQIDEVGQDWQIRQMNKLGDMPKKILMFPNRCKGLFGGVLL